MPGGRGHGGEVCRRAPEKSRGKRRSIDLDERKRPFRRSLLARGTLATSAEDVFAKPVTADPDRQTSESHLLPSFTGNHHATALITIRPNRRKLFIHSSNSAADARSEEDHSAQCPMPELHADDRAERQCQHQSNRVNPREKGNKSPPVYGGSRLYTSCTLLRNILESLSVLPILPILDRYPPHLLEFRKYCPPLSLSRDVPISCD